MPPFDEADFLTLRIGGLTGVPERLLLIGRARAGSVRVREWTSNSWNTEGQTHDVDAHALLAEIEAAYESRLPVSEEMHRIRVWLTGGG
ncbi:MAG: hypothetical protein ACT4P7_22230 [Gemmatimonadaceae bacterium]